MKYLKLIANTLLAVCCIAAAFHFFTTKGYWHDMALKINQFAFILLFGCYSIIIRKQDKQINSCCNKNPNED